MLTRQKNKTFMQTEQYESTEDTPNSKFERFACIAVVKGRMKNLF